MKRITLEELKERTHGKVGTPKRDKLEKRLDEEIKKAKRKKPTS